MQTQSVALILNYQTDASDQESRAFGNAEFDARNRNPPSRVIQIIIKQQGNASGSWN